MRDLIINGDPTMKTLTLTAPVTLSTGATIPTGTVIQGRLDYFYPAQDNNPTENNKANLLTDSTALLLKMDIDTATVNLALTALRTLSQSDLNAVNTTLTNSFNSINFNAGTVAEISSGITGYRKWAPNVLQTAISSLATGSYVIGSYYGSPGTSTTSQVIELGQAIRAVIVFITDITPGAAGAASWFATKDYPATSVSGTYSLLSITATGFQATRVNWSSGGPTPTYYILGPNENVRYTYIAFK